MERSWGVHICPLSRTPHNLYLAWASACSRHPPLLLSLPDPQVFPHPRRPWGDSLGVTPPELCPLPAQWPPSWAAVGLRSRRLQAGPAPSSTGHACWLQGAGLEDARGWAGGGPLFWDFHFQAHLLAFFKDFICLFLERREGREGETLNEVRENHLLPASHTPPTGDLARNPGIALTGD